MNEQANKGEVAALLRRIEEEYQAGLNGLYGLSWGTARHEFIRARNALMEREYNRLEQAVGEKQRAGELLLGVVEPLTAAAQERERQAKRAGKGGEQFVKRMLWLLLYGRVGEPDRLRPLYAGSDEELNEQVKQVEGEGEEPLRVHALRAAPEGFVFGRWRWPGMIRVRPDGSLLDGVVLPPDERLDEPPATC